MDRIDFIIERLTKIEHQLNQQKLLKKTMLNFEEACSYLQMSKSYLYKLTSQKQIPHFCPTGKRLYFNREELDEWLQQNRQETTEEINERVDNYLIQHKNKGNFK